MARLDVISIVSPMVPFTGTSLAQMAGVPRNLSTKAFVVLIA